jgi:hypothetical protein
VLIVYFSIMWLKEYSASDQHCVDCCDENTVRTQRLVQSPSSGAEELVEVVVTCVDDEGLWMRLDATDRALNRAAETEVWPQRSAFFRCV